MKEGNKVIRIKFSKHGLMRYIGHLDTMRFFQRLIRRSNIDAAYSEGFSPHQILSFAQPLGVGVESNAEYMDLEVKSLTTAEDMTERMNRETAEGIEILDMTLLPEKCAKAMASVYAAGYTVVFRPGHEPDWDIMAAVELFNGTESVKVMKKSKKSYREVELKELVYSLSVKMVPAGEVFPEGPLSGDVIDDEKKEVPVLDMVLSASSGDNVKPGLLIKALRTLDSKKHRTDSEASAPDTSSEPDTASGSGVPEEEEYPSKTDLMITREELFDSNMKPLIDAGMRF